MNINDDDIGTNICVCVPIIHKNHTEISYRALNGIIIHTCCIEISISSLAFIYNEN